MVRRTIKRLISAVGYELVRKASVDRPAGDPSSWGGMCAALERAVKNGLQAATIIDVGVATGTPALYAAFPQATLVLVEPLCEFLPAINKLVESRSNAFVVEAVATSQCGTAKVNVHPDLVGSSIFRESEPSDVNGFERSVKAETLDSICARLAVGGPYVLKIDVQGAEIEVLKGAERVLMEAEYVVLETSLWGTFENGPQMPQVIDFMFKRGFVPYDLFGPLYRVLDDALFQIDMSFVREDGVLRRCPWYATPAQRAQHNEVLASKLARQGITPSSRADELETGATHS